MLRILGTWCSMIDSAAVFLDCFLSWRWVSCRWSSRPPLPYLVFTLRDTFVRASDNELPRLFVLISRSFELMSIASLTWFGS
jgi:hypothetical protein